MAKTKTYNTNTMALVAVGFTLFGLILGIVAVTRARSVDLRTGAAGQPTDTVPDTAVGEAVNALSRLQKIVDNMEKAQSAGDSSSDVASLARQLVQEQKMVEEKLQEAKEEGHEYEYIADNFQLTLKRQEEVLEKLINQTQTQTSSQTQAQLQTQNTLKEAYQNTQNGMLRIRKMLEE